MNNKKIFSNEPKFDIKIKNFIIAFAVFIVILSVCSVVLFMYSLDFDISNLVESTTQEETTTESVSEVFSVDNLSGKSNILFILTDNNDGIETVFCTLVDFDNKSFKVKQLDGDTQLAYDNVYKSVNGIYKEYSYEGLRKLFFDNWGIKVDKYAAFNAVNSKKFLSSFNGISINVTEKVDYRSAEFNLELDKGKQEVSGEKALNYLKVCNKESKEQVLCEIISSLLKPEYSDNAEVLFKNFANCSETNISIIDFSESLENLVTYCNADDKFSPSPYISEETK